MRKDDKDAVPYWQEMIEFMSVKWAEKKNGTPFYWHRRFFPDLRVLAGLYRAWGVASLWQTYLGLTDQYAKGSGYSFEMFQHKIPSLVDDPGWKARARKIQDEWEPKMPNEIADVLKVIVPDTSPARGPKKMDYPCAQNCGRNINEFENQVCRYCMFKQEEQRKEIS